MNRDVLDLNSRVPLWLRDRLNDRAIIHDVLWFFYYDHKGAIRLWWEPRTDRRILTHGEYGVVRLIGMLALSVTVSMLVIAVGLFQWSFVVLAIGLLGINWWIAKRAYSFR